MPGEAGERLGRGAARLAEPRHLGEPARDQRRLRVVAGAEPVAGAGRERDHVLRGGAQLDADQVVVEVDAEDARVERLLQRRARAPRPRSRSRSRPAGPPRPPRPCSAPTARRPGGRVTSVERRVAGRRVEPLRRGSGAAPSRAAPRRPTRNARLGSARRQVGVDGRLGDRRRATSTRSTPAGSAGCARSRDRRASSASRRERDREAALGEQPREPRPPRAAADDDGPLHDLGRPLGSRSPPARPRSP